MGLQRYREKRDFAVTPEPKGQKRPQKGFSYVIQKHAASHLHYDFRLELDGVLLSWAVPKGPSLDPQIRRLAMQTEDHPVEYGSFEGTIPQGEYGGGTVMVWDYGSWEPQGDARKAYEKGHLRFALHGKKLRGVWHLVRTSKPTEEKRQWLLFKSKDDEARSDGSIVEEETESAQTGRTMEEIANARGKVWHSNRATNGAANTRNGHATAGATSSKEMLRPSKGEDAGETRSSKKARTEQPAKPKTAPKVTVRLTHPERVLYPKESITKQEFAEYYAAVSEWMLPHVANRPLTLVRCPQGVGGKQRFFQKHAKPPLGDGIRAIPIADEDGPAEYMAIDGVEGLLSLAQMSTLEIHTWGAHADDPEKPDFLVFDLDPDDAVPWKDVITCAQLLRKGLAELGLESYVKTTGGKGLHVCFPIVRRVSWDEAKEFCRAFTEIVVRVNPNGYVATMSKARRKGKIFIDFFRNGRGATFIAPYSTRARDGATVAMPLAWDELSPKIGPDHFHLRNVMKRLHRLSEDPWAEASSKKQPLTAAAVRAVMNPPRH
jgi:bifunctional non-homologous end joining protein LigD